MVNKLVDKLVVRRYGEDKIDYIFRRQDMRNRITDFIEGVIATIVLGAMVLSLTWAYLTAPIEDNPIESGYSDPEAIECPLEQR